MIFSCIIFVFLSFFFNLLTDNLNCRFCADGLNPRFLVFLFSLNFPSVTPNDDGIWTGKWKKKCNVYYFSCRDNFTEWRCINFAVRLLFYFEWKEKVVAHFGKIKEFLVRHTYAKWPFCWANYIGDENGDALVYDTCANCASLNFANSCKWINLCRSFGKIDVVEILELLRWPRIMYARPRHFIEMPCKWVEGKIQPHNLIRLSTRWLHF